MSPDNALNILFHRKHIMGYLNLPLNSSLPAAILWHAWDDYNRKPLFASSVAIVIATIIFLCFSAWAFYTEIKILKLLDQIDAQKIPNSFGL